MSKRPWIVAAAVLGVLLGQATPALAQEAPRTYSYLDLGVLGRAGDRAEAFAVNNAGAVVGTSSTEFMFFPRAFLWRDGRLSDLGVIGGPARRASDALGVNDAGDIVGASSPDSRFEPPHPFLRRAGDSVLTDLGTGFGSGSFASAEDINAAGQIVGRRARSQGPFEAFLYEDGVFRDLGTLGGRTTAPWDTNAEAHAINDLGQVVGEALPASGHPVHGFLWQNGAMRDLGTLGGNGEATQAFGINNAGQVVGGSQTARKKIHAFAWHDGVMRDLGTLGGDFSQAADINIRGQIVGHSRLANVSIFQTGHAFLWEGGRMVDLNRVTTNLPRGTVLEFANAINDQGWIVGRACLDNCSVDADVPAGPDHAFLLRPNS